MRPRWTGTIPVGLEHISVERHSAVKGNKRVSRQLNGKKESVSRRNERNAAAPRAARGTSMCVPHRKTA